MDMGYAAVAVFVLLGLFFVLRSVVAARRPPDAEPPPFWLLLPYPYSSRTKVGSAIVGVVWFGMAVYVIVLARTS